MVRPDYEFKDLTVPQLRGLAEQFDVNLHGKTRKPDIIKEIEGANITWDMYEALQAVPEFEDDLEPIPAPEQSEPVQEPLPFEVEWPDYSAEDDDHVEGPVEPEVVIAPVKEEEPEYIVVKMDRDNRVFQAFGYEFTRERPYMLVKQEEADVLIEEIGGFRAASPRELREYYGE